MRKNLHNGIGQNCRRRNKVHKEIRIPIVNQEDGDYCKDIMKHKCIDYLKDLIDKKRAFIDNDIMLHHPTRGNKNPTNENINISQSWIVSQYKGIEYNPWHQHSGHLSSVIYLKLPKGMNEFFEKEERRPLSYWWNNTIYVW